MKYLLALIALLTALFHPVGTLSAQSLDLGGTTRAVVVGISDYQDKDIPDLRFADKDAEAFANFLRSPAGGSLDGDHLKVLLNSEATLGQFANALDWLWEVSEEGDQAIIYFSGHGDVEKKSLTQPGFLLCWDAPSRIYMGGGAFALPMLQEVISTLSIQNKAKVVVITDACRSGSLSGNSVGGAQATAANLAKQYANEIKILSCQPNEYSIEGEQWGGGRGAFSFNLVDALYGLADANNDLTVSLHEVGRYLEDHVTAEVAPVSQVPMVLGNRTERLAIVDANLLADLRSGKTSQMAMLSPIESRGMEDDVLAGVDTNVRELYQLFKKALKDKVFLSPETAPSISGQAPSASGQACADAYYERLIAEPKLERLHSTMRRNYAAALQDDAQQVMNKWLKTDMTEITLTKITKADKYQSYPRYLERAADLLGRTHYMYPVLKARRHFFEGYLLALSSQNPDKALGEKALAAFRSALQWQAGLPQAYWQMSSVFAYNLLQPDSAEYYTQQAIALHPSWILPYTNMALLLSVKYKQFDRSKSYLEQAMRIDSNSAIVWVNWGSYYYAKKEYAEAEKKFKKAIQLDSNYINAYNNLGNVYYKTNSFEAAERQYNKVIQLDSTFIDAYNNIGAICTKTDRNAEALQQYLKVIQLDSNATKTYKNLGNVYYDMHQFAEAEAVFKKAIQLDSTYVNAHIDLAVVYLETHKIAEAEVVLKKAIQLDSTKEFAFANLFRVYQEMGKYNEAETMLLKAIALKPKFVGFKILLGDMYLKMNRLEDAERAYREELSFAPDFADVNMALARLASRRQQTEQAWQHLEDACKKGFQDYHRLLADPDLAPLRATPEWKELMKKHFPDQYKD